MTTNLNNGETTMQVTNDDLTVMADAMRQQLRKSKRTWDQLKPYEKRFWFARATDVVHAVNINYMVGHVPGSNDGTSVMVGQGQ